jgi:uncharacterized ferredoxin-like protein
MCLAARTAPKGGGVDNIVTAIVMGVEKDAVAGEMRRIAEEKNMRAYLVNAQGVDDSELVVLIGSRLKRSGKKAANERT